MSTVTYLPSCPLTPAHPRGSVRLTRRGRLVVFVASLTLALAVVFLLAGGAVGTDSAGEPIPTEIVQVVPGDTLWGIASERAANGEVLSMIEQIEQLNALESVTVLAGQKIRVPLSTN